MSDREETDVHRNGCQVEPPPVLRGFRTVFGATPKAIALYRIGLGALLTLELVLRFRFLHAFYTDEGTMPRHLLLPKIDRLYRLVCIHCHFGTLLQQQILLAVQLMFAAMLAVGYRTRLAAVVSWYMYSSLILRNTWLYFILDRYFFYLLFYGMFLPLHRRWSIDAWIADSASRKNQTEQNDNTDKSADAIVVSPATVALKGLVVWIYLDAGGGKYMDALGGWTYHAKPLPALDTYCRHTLTAQYVYAILGPIGLRMLTPTVVWVELLAAPLTLLASYFGNIELANLAVATISALHFGISLTIRNAVLLSYVAIAAWAIFLPVGWTDAAVAAERQSNAPSSTVKSRNNEWLSLSTIVIGAMIASNVWFETVGDCSSGLKRNIFATLLQNRWNVFIGAEEYVTWEIAPGRLADGSVVDVWGRRDEVEWTMPGTGAPCTSTARPGRWRSFPYLAELEGEDEHVLWEYLCRQWNEENGVSDTENQGRRLLRYNFFMLQADVLPNMQFSSTRKRLVRSHECGQTWEDVVNERLHKESQADGDNFNAEHAGMFNAGSEL